ETAAVPQDLAAEFAGTQHAVGRSRQGNQHCIVRPRQSTLATDLLLEHAQQLLVETQPGAPKVGLAFVEPSRFGHHQNSSRRLVDGSAMCRYCGYVSQVEGVDPDVGSTSQCAPDP